MLRKYINFILIVLLLADLTYSFFQYQSITLDGDMASGIMPAEDVKPVLKDPLGISVITEHTVYPNPNRFFAHWAFYTYFNHVPQWIQHFVAPIDSVYLASAIAKLLMHLVILVTLAFCINGKPKIISSTFLIAGALVTPLLQTNGYGGYMGIIDASITYAFFYALPTAVLLLYYLPFYSDSFYGTHWLKNRLLQVILFLASFYVVLNGALNPGIILTVTALFGLKCLLETDKSLSWIKRVLQAFEHAPKIHLFFFSFISVLSLYSLYLGRSNSIFLGETISIAERYSRIPMGIVNTLVGKIGYPILLIGIGINIYLMRKHKGNPEFDKSLQIFNWIGLFSLCFILLLPLGGYKSYRSLILRYDTIIPITIGLMFIYGKSSIQILNHLQGKQKSWFILLLVLFAFIFTNADKPGFDKNKLQILALKRIANSNDKVVLIEEDCTVLSWEKNTDPAYSKLNGELLHRWNITKDNKLYYQLASKNQ